MENFFTLRRRRKHLREIRKHARHALHVDDDILNSRQKEKLEELIVEAGSIRAEDGKQADDFITKAPLRLAGILPRRKWHLLREYADIIAVAVTVAFGIRALFLQPFKIPTGSMQPTLFGIHYANANVPVKLPQPFPALLSGAVAAEAKIKAPGFLDIDSFKEISSNPLQQQTQFQIGGMNYRLPGDRDQIINYCRLSDTLRYNTGDVLCDGWLLSGDHLFVDRFSHHLTGLRRGDVIVFNTGNILYRSASLNGYYYIKRLIGLPGDTLKIENSMIHVRPRNAKDFSPITQFNPAFEKIYSNKGGYHGHLSIPGGLLGSPEATYTVPEDSFFALGDNSASSLDSRYWGVVPRANIVGKGLWVFWPFSRRWGLVDTNAPLEVNTNPFAGFPSMRMQ